MSRSRPVKPSTIYCLFIHATHRSRLACIAAAWRFGRPSKTIAFRSGLREGVDEKIGIKLNSHSEPLIFQLQAAHFFDGVVPFEKLEKTFEDLHALLASFLRHSCH